ncbi:PREDICTED: uncharacterized protein LOC106749978 [Dinoponera quadriceps]|uniref:Uncharacterized protein LOC106749978 n=1 Tax=Dinoponera quadriceps TaxID=609295 RepID=A0A6P3Y5U9_DINQU|nr:PREDICTED: uncharacterized protein LOC106749978 [Dinoponera quadriceps]
MTTKFTIKHKDSLVLKENKSLQEKKCQSYNQFNLKKCEHLSFSWLIFSVFLIYWFVLCPLIWAICDVSKSYLLSYWPVLFWTVALLIWIMIMCALVIFWRRRLQARENSEINLITPKYGSDNVEKRLSVPQMSPGDANSLETKKTDNLLSQKETNDSANCRKKDLPPLMIHKQMSGENINDIGTVHVEKDENDQLDVTSERNSLQEHVKSGTVSENVAKSPKVPLSPRELFFIDLIREAEKTESAISLEKSHFFPKGTTQSDSESEKEIKNSIDMTNEKDVDVEDMKNEQDDDIKNESKCESNYFIADIESPVNEKSEVFLQIDSSVEEQLEINAENPVLILLPNKENV